MYMYVYIFMYLYIYTHTYTYIHLYAWTICLWIHACICTHGYMHVCMFDMRRYGDINMIYLCT